MRNARAARGKSPREWGRIHGESFRGEVAVARGDPHLPVHEGRRLHRRATQVHARPRRRTCRCSSAITTALYDELRRHRRGRGVSPEEIVVANHYTDLRDLDPDPASWRPAPTQDDPAATRHGTGAEASAATAAA